MWDNKDMRDNTYGQASRGKWDGPRLRADGDGASPGRIPYARQWIDDDDISAVVETLRGDYLTTGPKVGEFEEAVKAATGARYAVAVCNGTAALHAACFAAGVGSEAGGEAITSPMTFAASANCALYVGGRPVFCDVDADTWNMDASKIESCITERTKAIIPVHYAGLPCDMDAVMGVARRHGLAVIEDAAHAIGATYGGTAHGGANVGTAGDMACFSFHPVKQVTAGEGGAVTTNDAGLYRKLLQFRSHGITRDAALMASPRAPQPWYYEQQFLGYNYRLSDIHAALGASQLKKLGAFIARRRQIAAAYAAAFSPLRESGSLALQSVPEGVGHAWHLFVVKTDAARRDEIFRALAERGIGANLHYIPVYLHPHYARLGYPKGLCPQAEELYSGLITLPLFPRMSDEDVGRVIAGVLECFPDRGSAS
jgi:UDP-4-amino-4,6-dideoxy-N-acetyl-beta-L-altrosamine transaminase